jgi:hypothetical protein
MTQKEQSREEVSNTQLSLQPETVSDLPRLRIDGLHDRHPGLTQALGDSYAEAAAVCWSRYHEPPITVLKTRWRKRVEARQLCDS